MQGRLSTRHERQPSWEWQPDEEEIIEPLTLTKEQYQATYAAVLEAYAKGNPPVIPGCEAKPAKQVAVAAPKAAAKPAKKFSKL